MVRVKFVEVDRGLILRAQTLSRRQQISLLFIINLLSQKIPLTAVRRKEWTRAWHFRFSAWCHYHQHEFLEQPHVIELTEWFVHFVPRNTFVNGEASMTYSFIGLGPCFFQRNKRWRKDLMQQGCHNANRLTWLCLLSPATLCLRGK